MLHSFVKDPPRAVALDCSFLTGTFGGRVGNWNSADSLDDAGLPRPGTAGSAIGTTHRQYDGVSVTHDNPHTDSGLPGSYFTAGNVSLSHGPLLSTILPWGAPNRCELTWDCILKERWNRDDRCDAKFILAAPTSPGPMVPDCCHMRWSWIAVTCALHSWTRNVPAQSTPPASPARLPYLRQTRRIDRHYPDHYSVPLKPHRMNTLAEILLRQGDLAQLFSLGLLRHTGCNASIIDMDNSDWILTKQVGSRKMGADGQALSSTLSYIRGDRPSEYWNSQSVPQTHGATMDRYGVDNDRWRNRDDEASGSGYRSYYRRLAHHHLIDGPRHQAAPDGTDSANLPKESSASLASTPTRR